jgi:hypothetical protein
MQNEAAVAVTYFSLEAEDAASQSVEGTNTEELELYSRLSVDGVPLYIASAYSGGWVDI